MSTISPLKPLHTVSTDESDPETKEVSFSFSNMNLTEYHPAFAPQLEGMEIHERNLVFALSNGIAAKILNRGWWRYTRGYKSEATQLIGKMSDAPVYQPKPVNGESSFLVLLLQKLTWVLPGSDASLSSITVEKMFSNWLGDYLNRSGCLKRDYAHSLQVDNNERKLAYYWNQHAQMQIINNFYSFPEPSSNSAQNPERIFLTKELFAVLREDAEANVGLFWLLLATEQVKKQYLLGEYGNKKLFSKLGADLSASKQTYVLYPNNSEPQEFQYPVINTKNYTTVQEAYEKLSSAPVPEITGSLRDFCPLIEKELERKLKVAQAWEEKIKFFQLTEPWKKIEDSSPQITKAFKMFRHNQKIERTFLLICISHIRSPEKVAGLLQSCGKWQKYTGKQESQVHESEFMYPFGSPIEYLSPSGTVGEAFEKTVESKLQSVESEKKLFRDKSRLNAEFAKIKQRNMDLFVIINQMKESPSKVSFWTEKKGKIEASTRKSLRVL